MIFVDTNYFLRYLLHDNEEQYLVASSLFEEGATGKKGLFTSTIVIFELQWVLASVYAKQKTDILPILKSVMSSLSFVFIEERALLEEALRLYEKENISLADCYNLLTAQKRKAESFATFDQRLLKLYPTLSDARRTGVVVG
ncbi:MAG: PIN domain-containing protein [Patescibacteria group bacterium]